MLNANSFYEVGGLDLRGGACAPPPQAETESTEFVATFASLKSPTVSLYFYSNNNIKLTGKELL
jgi:hypothetical protein